MLIIILGALIGLAMFFYFNNQRIRRMEEHHEHSKERFQKLLDTIQNKKEDTSPAENKGGDVQL